MRPSIKDWFIPHADNNHHPKILHPRSLRFLALLALTAKIAVVLALFIAYPNQARMSAEIQADVFKLINLDRQKQGLSPLVENAALDNAALLKAHDMAERGYFEHRSPGGNWPWDWIDREEYPYLYAGENLAMSFSSAESVHQALMNSESHRKNILADKYEDIGLAMVPATIDGAETNVLVELFASRQNKQLVKLITVSAPPKLPVSLPTVPPIPVQPPVTMPKTIPRAQSPSPVVASESNLPSLPTAVFPSARDPRLVPAARTIQVYKANDHGFMKLLITMRQTSRYLLMAIVILLCVAFGMNTFIRVRVQHKSVVLQTVLTTMMVITLLTVRFHFLETIFEFVTVL